MIETRSIAATETYDLRHRYLRSNQPLSTCAFPYDTAPSALHLGAFLDGQLIGIGSIVPEPRERALHPISWRIRGMAVVENARRTGVGSIILQTLIDYARTRPLPAEIWCNGRAYVKEFYERFGFAQEGDLFELPEIGPLVLMVKNLM